MTLNLLTNIKFFDIVIERKNAMEQGAAEALAKKGEIKKFSLA